MGEIIQFPVIIKEPLHPVSELIAAKPELWERLLGAQALESNIILSEN